jgi:hypothetical protein
VQGTRRLLENAADRGVVDVAAVVTIHPDAKELVGAIRVSVSSHLSIHASG